MAEVEGTHLSNDSSMQALVKGLTAKGGAHRFNKAIAKLGVSRVEQPLKAKEIPLA